MAKLMGTLMTIGALVALSSGSAIPMWEFLSRGEKVSACEHTRNTYEIIMVD